MSTPLPPLQPITLLSPTTIRILAHNPSKFTLQGTNTYLVGSGSSRYLIDTGEGKPEWLASLKQALATYTPNADGTPITLAGVLLTHWHRDHIGGVADVLRTWPGTKIWKRKRQEEEGSGHPDDELAHDWQAEEIVDGQVFAVPGATLTAVATPGHTTDHTVFVLREENALFTGDNVLGHGTSVFEDLSAYVGSLDKMRGLFPAGKTGRGYPGHGDLVEDGRARIEEYIRHRAMREEQVVRTLREGGEMTAMEIVAVIYKDVAESLHPAAAHGVMLILKKLEKEGRVMVVEGEEEEKWRLVKGGAAGRSAL
ncbi:hypothetical protein VTJ04DRAFT_10731 [Mycothermus thermophilus]|uniref:uncharacterized protein n=1 Tax=Humicola insolens TaxID=85995 RepID=UPI003741EE5B